MANHVAFNDSLTTTDNTYVYDLLYLDTLFIDRDATVAYTGASFSGAAVGTADSTDITINGTLYAARSSAIKTTTLPAAGYSAVRIVVGTTGNILTDGLYGIQLSGGFNEIQNFGLIATAFDSIVITGGQNNIFNAGTISSDANAAIDINGSGSSGSTIRNTGTIYCADAYGIKLDGNSGVFHEVWNSGLISAHVAVLGSAGREFVTNLGTIEGAVILGDSDDSFDSITGIMSGTVDGGGGDDVLLGSTTSANKLYGGTGADTLQGGNAADYLHGGDGADEMTGGLGNDVYVIDSYSDVVVEEAGGGTADAIQSFSINIALANFANVENASLLGNTRLGISGTAGKNVLSGASNTAANTLTGLGGNDSYIVGPGDIIVEAAGGGTDTVYTGLISIDLNLAAYANVERLVLTGANQIHATGNSGNNFITGNSALNIIRGNGGQDIMTGAGGNDIFVFANMTDSGTTGSTWDLITDFNSGDKINLALIDANGAAAGDPPFQFIGAGAFYAPGQVRYVHSGAYTFIEGNVTGTSGAEFIIALAGIHALTGVDFTL